MAELIRGEHFVIETDYVRFLRREIPSHAEKFVAYYVPADERTVVGVWLDRLAGEVRELSSYGPEGPDRDTTDTVKFNLKPHRVAAGIQDWLRAARAKKRAHLRRREDREREATRRQKFWYKWGEKHGIVAPKHDPAWSTSVQ